MARYRLLKRGVFDTLNNREVEPIGSDPAWEEYLTWFAAGNIADPVLVPPPEPPNLREFYRQQGAARTERQMQRLSNDEFIDLLRKGGAR